METFPLEHQLSSVYSTCMQYNTKISSAKSMNKLTINEQAIIWRSESFPMMAQSHLT